MRPLILIAALLTAACEPSFQTTSTADYLAARPGVEVDPEIVAAAQVGQANLQFPARIAVAQTDRYGRLTAVSPQLEPLMARAAQMGLGQVVPLNPLLAGDLPTNSVDGLRQLAARQHTDYVLVINLARRGSNGQAHAAFIDVRTGYPYASAQGTAGVGWSNEASANARLIRALRPDLEAMIDGLAARAN